MKKTIMQQFNDLTKAIDVDGGYGREVPINMNFTGQNFLTKDTGFEYVGDEDNAQRHSLYPYKKDDGTEIKISVSDTKLQKWNGTAWEDITGYTVTPDHEFGYVTYDNKLYGGNGVDDFFEYDGTTLTTHSSLPKGNIFEIFEDRLFVSGVPDNPLSLYYSDVGNPTSFPTANVIKPLGTDNITALWNYYGVLLIFKRHSLWKVEFIYNQVASDFLPKLQIQSKSYGALNKDSVAWVENGLWFFDGNSVRSVEFIDQQTGQFGVNRAILSEQIKETLEKISQDGIKTFYYDRKFYLITENTTFVCHLLHNLAWTKYANRVKNNIKSIAVFDEKIHTTTETEPFRFLKWTDALNDAGEPIHSKVYFKRVENPMFNRFVTYRYLDVKFKSLSTVMKIVIKSESSDFVSKKVKEAFVGNLVENMENPLAEVPVGQELVADSFGEAIETSQFIKKRVSFLTKSQALIIGFEHDRVDETFTLSEYILVAFEQPYKQIGSRRILSVK